MWRLALACLVILAHVFVCVLVGLLLFRRGLRGRYVGEEPRCRTCTYQLTGRLDAERCPECGTELSPDTIVRGLRKPRWGFVIAGLLVAPTLWWSTKDSMQAVVDAVVYAKWYRYYPTRLVLCDAQADQLDAITELERRIHTGSLSRGECNRIAELALTRIDQGTAAKHTPAYVRILARLNDRRLLSGQQRDQLFSSLARTSLTVRPVVRQGDPVALRLDYHSLRSEMSGYCFWHEPIRVRVAGREVFTASGEDWRNRSADWHWYGSALPTTLTILGENALPVGMASVEYAEQHVFKDSCGTYWGTEDPSWLGEISLAATMEILPSYATDPVSWVVDPDMENRLREAMRVCMGDFCILGKPTADPPASPGDVYPAYVETHQDHGILHVRVGFSEPAPVPVAFDLVIQAGGLELPTEAFIWIWTRARESAEPVRPDLTWNLGEVGERDVEVEVQPFTANEVYVILRGSRDVARRTVDLYEVCQGELRFGPFPVEHAAP